MDDIENVLAQAVASSYDKVHNIEAPKEEPAAKEAAPAPAESEQDSTDQGNESQSKPETPAETPVQPLAPPARWSDERKKVFLALPREAQNLVLERESEYESGISQKSQEYAKKSQAYEGLEELLAPRREAWKMNGFDDKAALQQLFAISDYANRDTPGFIKWYAAQKGIDLSTLINPQAGTQEEYQDPAMVALSTEIKQIKNALSSQAEAQNKALAAQAAKDIEGFKNAKDDKGNPVNKYFDEVKADMGLLIQSGRAKDLSEAYEMAMYANKDVRAKVLEEQRKQEEAKRIEEAKAAAAKAAKVAGTNIKRKAGIQGERVKTGTWEDTVSEAANNVFDAA